MRRTRIAFAIGVAASVGLALLAGGYAFEVPEAAAQARRPAARHPAQKRPAKPAATPAPSSKPSSSASTPPAPVGPHATGASSVEPEISPDAGVVSVKTSDGGATTIVFRELDIEGRLKSPQLVYFLRRVRAEFAAGDLGHRSFMRELSDTRRDPSF